MMCCLHVSGKQTNFHTSWQCQESNPEQTSKEASVLDTVSPLSLIMRENRFIRGQTYGFTFNSQDHAFGTDPQHCHLWELNTQR